MSEVVERIAPKLQQVVLSIPYQALTIPQSSVWISLTLGSATYVTTITPLPSSTEASPIPTELEQLASTILVAARDEVFEDGIISQFAKGLIYLVEAYGDLAVQEFSRRITTGKVDTEVVSEALRWIGRINHKASQKTRLWLLERSLFSISTRVRDGAGLGLASMGDPAAVPYLRQAIQREKVDALRDDFQQVLNQLENVK